MSTWPGKELKNDELRAAAQMLCRDQRWTYEYTGSGRKPKLYNPEGNFTTLPLTPGSYGSVLKTLAQLKRMGAVLDKIESRALRRARFVGESLFSDQTDSPWDAAEWRERQAEAPEWRQRIAGYVEPEPEPEPEPVVLSGYAAGLMGRLTGAAQVRPDAMGNGQWSLAEARQMLKDGYALDRVIERTGWGRMWLSDLADRLAAG